MTVWTPELLDELERRRRNRMYPLRPDIEWLTALGVYDTSCIRAARKEAHHG